MAASASSHGILNPKGIGWSLASVGYFAAIPVSSWLAQPNYVVEKSLALLLQVGSASSASTSGAALISDKAKAIPALSVLYLFVTYAASAATSVAAQAMGREEGLDGSGMLRFRFAYLRLALSLVLECNVAS
ncbi:MAG: hypothetical protein M1831_001789 [Alyxoria varia]|nr:MAG: hypothetical protein M1831_001789 [Alyxoria varia]